MAVCRVCPWPFAREGELLDSVAPWRVHNAPAFLFLYCEALLDLPSGMSLYLDANEKIRCMIILTATDWLLAKSPSAHVLQVGVVQRISPIEKFLTNRFLLVSYILLMHALQVLSIHCLIY